MKKFLVILILILTFQTSSQADDIRDLEIEGISVGDSLLDFFSEKEIKSTKQRTQYPNDKFIVYQLDQIKSLDIYTGLNISTKKNDKKYIVSSIQAIIYYDDANEFKNCNSERKKIIAEISNIVKNAIRRDKNYLSYYDNKSPVEGTVFDFDNGESITVNCNDWRKETQLTKNLDVGVSTKEFVNFLINEAYK